MRFVLFGLLAGAVSAMAADSPSRWQPSQYQVDYWGPQDGLPEEGLTGIAQDSRGFFWLSTLNGLVRFDGGSFRVHVPRGSVERRAIRAMAMKDRAGGEPEFWLKMRSGETARFHGGHFEVRPDWPFAEQAGLLDGDVLLFTDKGVFRAEGGGLQPVTWERREWRGAVRSAVRDRHGARWLGLKDGLILRERGGGWEAIARASAEVVRLEVAPDGSVWALSEPEVLECNGAAVRRYPMRKAEGLLATADGAVWVGSADGLSWRHAGKGFERFPLPGNTGPVVALAVDRSGDVWAATGVAGLYRIPRRAFRNWGVSEGLPDLGVRVAFETSRGEVWLSHSNGEVSRLVRGECRTLPIRFPIPPVQQWAEGPDGSLWALRRKQIYRIAPGSLQPLPISLPLDAGAFWDLVYSRFHRSLFVLAEGGFWRIETGQPPRRWAVRGLPQNLGPNLMLREASDGRLFVVTPQSIFEIDAAGRAREIQLEPGARGRLFTAHVSGDDTLWVGVNGGGLLRVRQGNAVAWNVPGEDPMFFVYGIAEDRHGYLWLGLRSKLARVRRADVEAFLDGRRAAAPPIEYWDTRDGLVSANFGRASRAVMTSATGRLWWIHLTGIVEVDPLAANWQPQTPHVFLASAVFRGRTLPVENNTIRIRSSLEALQLRGQGVALDQYRLSYRHRMLGLNEEWSPAGTGVAEYTNLSPGSYRFEIVARAKAGAPWSEPATMEVIVEPYWYQTGWFQATAVTLGLAILAGLFRLRERRLRAEKLELEQRVNERTADLRSALAVSEQAKRAKSEFLANMSHEIRTPMSATVGTTDLLMEMNLPLEAKEHLTTIRASGEALLALINDILDYSKIEAGKLELERRRFNLVECIEEALALVSVTAHGKGLMLEDNLDPEVPEYIDSDPTRLRQILLNLLSNAIKFTSRGSVRLSVELESSGGGERSLHFAVRDTGIGITPVGMSKLFQEFSQADSSTTRKFGGTGLGLAISKKLTAAFGGRIWVESELGTGSTFHFTVPVGNAGAAVPPPASGDRILLLLENVETAEGLRKRLQRIGRRDIAAVSASQLAGLPVAERAFDFVFVDHTLVNPVAASVVAALRAANSGVKFIEVAQNRSVSQREGLTDAVLPAPIRTSALRHLLTDPGLADERQQATTLQLAERIPLTILLAEDNKVNQRVILSMLRRLGYEADLAANGLQVLEAMRKRSYDLIFMDVHMPEMDGLDATRNICEEWPEPARPSIVALTAGAFDENRAECLTAGMRGFVTKPIRIAELATAIEAFAPARTLIP